MDCQRECINKVAEMDNSEHSGDETCNECLESKKLLEMESPPKRKKKLQSLTDSYAVTTDVNIVLTNCATNIKCLYGIIVMLSVIIFVIVWILQQQINVIKIKCSSVSDSKPSENVEDFSVLEQLLESWNKPFVRNKRSGIHSNKKKINKRRRRSDMTSTLHEYCRTVYNLCDTRSLPGPPGVPVAQGPPGPPGPMGPKGEMGLKGEKGTTGRFGFDGIAGSPGNKGEPGIKGDRGLLGFPGAKGDKGYTGAKGDRGLMGPKGDKGSTGRAGPPGPTGAPGPAGPEGRRGKGGDDGPMGPKGNKGFDGIPGVPGFKGVKGDLGDRGPPGYGINCICEKGDKGEKGVRGLVGFTGYKGDIGPMGPMGQKGYGQKGERGPEGPPGRRGEPGKKGDCDVWSKERHNFRVVKVDEREDKNKFNEIPQQNYQAPKEKTASTHNSGARGSRSSGTNSGNLASTTISSCMPYMCVMIVHFLIQTM